MQEKNHGIVIAAVLIGVMLVGLGGLYWTNDRLQPSGSSYAPPRIIRGSAVTGAVVSSSVQANLNALASDPTLQEQFNIKTTAWLPASPAGPAHAFIVGCHDCAGAIYSSTGALLNAADLQKIPTSWVLRVPTNWNGKQVIVVPPSLLDQTLASPILAAVQGALMGQGFAFAAMNHPSPGKTQDPLSPLLAPFDYADFIEAPYHTHDLKNMYFATAHQIKSLISNVFGTPIGTYALGWSRGGDLGVELLASRSGNPFDGHVLLNAGNGRLEQAESLIRTANSGGMVPLSGIPYIAAGFPMPVVQGALAELIGIADPDYRASVLAGQASALAYNVATRPRDVQQAWSNLDVSGDLTAKTIVIQGNHDRIQFPDNTIEYADNVVASGKSDVMRLYFLRNTGHSPADLPTPLPTLFVTAINRLDAWVQSNVEPGPLANAPFDGPIASCTTLGFHTNPLGCFCKTMEIGGVPTNFLGAPITECN